MRHKKYLLIASCLCLCFLLTPPFPALGKTTLMWGATNQSSGAYPMNVAMAEVINKHVPEVSVTVVETGGTNDNFRRMERGEVSFGQSSATDSHTANHGIGIWQGKSMARPRVLVSANPQAFIFVVTEESGIRGLSDLNGQPYCPGLKGSTTELLSYSVFKSLDITPKFMPGSTGEAVDAMKDRRIVGYTKNSTLTSPDSSLQDVATTRKIRLLSFSKEEQQAFLKLYPYYTFVTMPAAVYAQAGDAETLGADFGVAVDKELSADLVYKIAKALCENSEYIGQSYAGVRGVDMAELTARATAWLHPGVIRYLKEKGYALDPAMQYPPEYKD